MTGCAATGKNPKDPYESFNRTMFKFNDGVDRVALKPAATAYKQVLPTFVQTGVSNFFGNLSDIWSGANNLMQGKGQDGMSDLTRFALNSTFGLAGFLDIASEAGLRKHNEDFGQTLGAWGFPSGPYLMLPLLGPSTVRDASVMPLDIAADPWAYKDPVKWRNVGTALRAVDQRAAVLDASNLMEEAALDRYEFIRDGFLQRRESKITDGGDRAPVPLLQKGAAMFKKGAPEAAAKPVDDGLPSDAKTIRAAYADEPAAPAAKPADDGLPSDAKAIRAAYADDPAPPPPAAKSAPVSSEPASK
ncbi:MAG: VacJ family lipoprotein [Massilia sp.]